MDSPVPAFQEKPGRTDLITAATSIAECPLKRWCNRHVLDQIAYLFSEDVARDVNINNGDRHTFMQRDIDNR